MNVVIIDDSKLNREAIKILIANNFSHINIVNEANSVKSALTLFNEVKPDLVFLDIELGDGNAFDLLNQLEFKDFAIIFITAYNNFAVQAFENNAIDYLLKPINLNKLGNAIKKATSFNNSENITKLLESFEPKIEHENQDFIAISSQEEIEYISISDLIRLEADGKYTKCILKENNREIVSSKNLGEFEKKLPEKEFIRVHHSHIINSNHIRKLSKKDFTITLSNSDVVPISTRKKENILKMIDII